MKDVRVRIGGLKIDFNYLVATGKVTKKVDVLKSIDGRELITLPSGKIPVFLNAEDAEEFCRQLPKEYNSNQVRISEVNLPQYIREKRITNQIVVHPQSPDLECDNTIFQPIFK